MRGLRALGLAHIALALIGCATRSPAVSPQIEPARVIIQTEPAQPASSTAAIAPASPVQPDPEPAPSEPPPAVEPPGEALAEAIAEQLKAAPQACASAGAAARAPNIFGETVLPAGEELAANLPVCALSPDKQRFAFIRGNSKAPSIWLANADGSSAREVSDLSKAPPQVPDQPAANDEAPHTLFDLQFAPDGKRVFFQTEWWTTSAALFTLDLSTRKVSFVTDANGYHIISACSAQPRYTGDIIVYQHSYGVRLATAFDAYFLLDRSGHELGVIGEGVDNVSRFLANSCGRGPRIPIPPPEKIPARFLSFPRCAGAENVLRYVPIHFLDGTQLPIFYAVKKARAHAPRVTYENMASPSIRLEDLVQYFDDYCARD